MSARAHRDTVRDAITNMIFIGGVDTDIPCMRACAGSERPFDCCLSTRERLQKARAEKLITDRRADFIAPANYSEGKRLDTIVHAIIDKIAANDAVRVMTRE